MSFYVPQSQKSVFGLAVLWLLGILAVIATVTVAVVVFKTLLAEPSGRAAAYRQKESAVNRVQKQEMFEQLAADVDGYTAQIGVAKQALREAKGVDVGLRATELLGLRQQCIATVQQYNAESGKYTSRDFKSAGLPYRLNTQACT